MKRVLYYLIVFGVICCFGMGAVKAETPTLSSLKVQGTNVECANKSVCTITSFKTSYDHITILATPSDESYTVTGAGEVVVTKDEVNTFDVTVANDTGEEKVYTIKVTVYDNGGSTSSSTTETDTSDGDVSTNPHTGAYTKPILLGFSFAIGLVFIKSSKNKYNRI